MISPFSIPKLKTSKTSQGFTLLELLIVIGIVAILSVALVFILNPGETLKKARDSQRISDLTTLKKAIEIYKTNVRSPILAGTSNNDGCKGTSLSPSWDTATDHIYYSYPSDIGGVDQSKISATALDGQTFSAGVAVQTTKANLGKTDGTGWLPINFASLPGGSPISALPVDPVNTIADITKPLNTDLVYRYVCSQKDLAFELGTTLESIDYTSTDNKMSKDGGNNDSYYEVGTSLALMSTESVLDPCQGVAVGDSCTNGVLYGGTGFAGLGSYKYMTTPGHCTSFVNNYTAFTPTCNGATDALYMPWANNSGTTAYGIITSATSTTAGATNTTTLATNYTDTDAARYCENMTYPAGGYTDWYLPAKDELNLVLYAMLSAGKGNFKTAFYLSSTEYGDGNNAWGQAFWGSGTQGNTGSKTIFIYLRCIRRYL
jgi:prepilin-type N-terminal cleavage/methylation domain-containing protein